MNSSSSARADAFMMSLFRDELESRQPRRKEGFNEEEKDKEEEEKEGRQKDVSRPHLDRKCGSADNPRHASPKNLLRDGAEAHPG